jgi:DNA-binding NarL/FixJ family response regulator
MSTIQVLVIDNESVKVEQKLKPLQDYFPEGVSFVPSFVESVSGARDHLIDRTRFDAVFLDIGEVDPDRDAIERIRSIHPYVPIVMLSQHSDSTMILEYLDLGARTFIPKSDLPPEVPRDNPSIRSQHENKARAVVNRILQAFEEYQAVKRLLGRSLENGTVRKSGPSHDLEHQLLFLKEMAEIEELAPFFPPVGSWEVMEHVTYYEMPFYEMKDMYKFLLGEPFRESCEDVAKRALAAVIGGPFLELSCRGRKRGITADIVPVLFFDRFRSRMKQVSENLRAVGDAAEPAARDFGRLLDCQSTTIGGERLRNPAAVVDEIAADSAFCQRLTPPFLSWVHGDLHFKNILLDDRLPQMMELKLVDPRGTGVNGYPPGTGDPAYDLGKLLFSSRGRWHLIQDQLFRPPRGSLRFGDRSEATVEQFDKYPNERAPVRGGLSTARLSAYRATVQPWIWEVFAELGQYVKELVESTDYPKEDPDWWLRACLYEGMHCCSLAPILVDKDPEVATNLFLWGTKLLNEFWSTFGRSTSTKLRGTT